MIFGSRTIFDDVDPRSYLAALIITAKNYSITEESEAKLGRYHSPPTKRANQYVTHALVSIKIGKQPDPNPYIEQLLPTDDTSLANTSRLGRVDTYLSRYYCY